MTLEELRANVDIIKAAIINGKSAWNSLDRLVIRVDRIINSTDPMRLPPTQAEVDNIVTIQTPLYLASLTAIEQAGDALGTDAFN